MEALDALLNRVSAPRLLDPAPTVEQSVERLHWPPPEENVQLF